MVTPKSKNNIFSGWYLHIAMISVGKITVSSHNKNILLISGIHW